METEAIALDRDVIGADERPSGSVRLTVTEMLATPLHHAPHASLSRAPPRGHPRARVHHARRQLARREADVALRLSRPREDSVVGRRLASVPLSLRHHGQLPKAHRCLPAASRAVAVWHRALTLGCRARAPRRLSGRWRHEGGDGVAPDRGEIYVTPTLRVAP
jgi:hypothetical protein